MPVVQRAGRKHQEGEEACHRAAKPPAEAPRCEQSEQSHCSANEPPCFEQAEWQDFCCQRCHHVETAAIHVQVHKRKSALIAKAGSIERYEQSAILGMRVVIPAEAIVAKGCK